MNELEDLIKKIDERLSEIGKEEKILENVKKIMLKEVK